MKERGKYRRTPEVRQRVSDAMRRSWQARKAEYPPEVRINATVKARDARMFPRFGQTAAAAVSALLEGASLLKWTFAPEKGRWVPSLPKCGACAGAEEGFA